jgi:FAD/FMN-containing dehydrogenase
MFLDELRAIIEADRVSTEPGDLAIYGRDWTRVHEPKPCAVVWPKTSAEVSSILALCQRARIPVVPSGGRTGLAGGAVAREGELVLSLERMRRMDPVDVAGATVRVQAGAVTQAVHAHCAPHGLTWPLDMASKGSSQVGGNISTNAGGVKVIRYGLTRQWVLGLEVVLMDGRVLELNGALEKNNTGLDLRQLFIGTEGTLGVITEATLKLTPLPTRLDVVLFAASDLGRAVGLLREARSSGMTLAAFEFFTDRCLTRVMRHRKLSQPFSDRHGAYVLVEIENASSEAIEAWTGSVLERGAADDAVIAAHRSQAAQLWEYREGISESLSATGLPHKNDVALPVAALDGFCSELDRVFADRYPGWEICVFGHLGDGNLHINVMKPDDLAREDFLSKTHQADHHMFELVRSHRGSISAEHGIGLLKRPHLHFSRTDEELRLMVAMKRVLDPNGLLNPGKIFPAG